MMFSKPLLQSLLDFHDPEIRQVWLVVYMDPPKAGQDAPSANRLLTLLLKLLKPGFQHVLAVSPVGRNRWLVCNPGSCNMALGLADSRTVLQPIQRGVASGQFHCQTVLADPPRVWQFRFLFSCSNVIAHLVGMKARALLTPYGLYRQIAAMQAEQKTPAPDAL